MRRLRVFALLLCLGGSACVHPPATILTPAGKIAYTAESVQVRVTELQNTAIQAEATGGLPTATARIIVRFSVDASRILKTTPAGWVAALQTAWTAAKVQLGPQTNPAVIAAMTAVDAVLAAVGGTP